MPTYEYRCPKGHEFEQFVLRISEAAATLPCPTCGESAGRRISAGAGLLFKGSGFYITDYGKDGKKDQRAKEAKASADAAKSGASDAGGQSSHGKSSDGKSSEGKSSDGKSSDGKSSDAKTSEGRSTDVKQSAAAKPAAAPPGTGGSTGSSGSSPA